MKSRALTVKDPASIDISTYIKPFVLDQSKLDKELARLTNPYIRWEKGTTVSKGDMVICKLKSDCQRFNRAKVKFVVGSGMFHTELENLIIGMAVGETRNTVLPEGQVALTLTEVTNKIVPEINDNMVEKLEIDDVHTLSDYRAYLIRQQQEQDFNEMLYEPLQYLIDGMISQSEFILCHEDWKMAAELRLNRTRALAKQDGMILEEMTPEQFEGRIPVKSYTELIVLEQDGAWENLCIHLIGKWFSDQDGFSPNEVSYEEYIQDYVNGWKISEESVREIEPYPFYAFFAYNTHAINCLKQIIETQYKKINTNSEV